MRIKKSCLSFNPPSPLLVATNNGERNKELSQKLKTPFEGDGDNNY
ncbi:MAG: hypothetical protein K1X26_06650 [Chitinophagales bacterium]|nr:hypothetical protein [Chitinophagales bacterium]HMU97701.1 hypothetical protein [Chitinophagales bacterium]HMV02508.1 hypothetical protein [Chitinophagales bacterium]HMZ94888.1 hypothetical protein [Chitinophagales bacterium]HNG08001.1 hypothetical protein [Chitinophagales bacterium]